MTDILDIFPSLTPPSTASIGTITAGLIAPSSGGTWLRLPRAGKNDTTTTYFNTTTYPSLYTFLSNLSYGAEFYNGTWTKVFPKRTITESLNGYKYYSIENGAYNSSGSYVWSTDILLATSSSGFYVVKYGSLLGFKSSTVQYSGVYPIISSTGSDINDLIVCGSGILGTVSLRTASMLDVTGYVATVGDWQVAYNSENNMYPASIYVATVVNKSGTANANGAYPVDIYSSTDGKTWSNVSYGLTNAISARLSYANGKFWLFVNQTSSNVACYSSTDGWSWTSVSVSTGSVLNLRYIFGKYQLYLPSAIAPYPSVSTPYAADATKIGKFVSSPLNTSSPTGFSDNSGISLNTSVSLENTYANTKWKYGRDVNGNDRLYGCNVDTAKKKLTFFLAKSYTSVARFSMDLPDNLWEDFSEWDSTFTNSYYNYDFTYFIDNGVKKIALYIGRWRYEVTIGGDTTSTTNGYPLPYAPADSDLFYFIKAAS